MNKLDTTETETRGGSCAPVRWLGCVACGYHFLKVNALHLLWRCHQSERFDRYCASAEDKMIAAANRWNW